jgi:hypothetical protein
LKLNIEGMRKMATHREEPIHTVEYKTENGTQWTNGLTKLEFFAAVAMQGWLASPDVIDLKFAAKKAVEAAKELIEELNK